MAFRSYRRTTRRVGRKLSSKKRTRRTYSTRRKRSTYRRKPATRRRILNVSSNKKQDTVLGVSGSDAGTPDPLLGSSIAGTTGNRLNSFLWCPSFRYRSDGVGYNRRSKTVTYFRGVREAITFTTADGVPWVWRRIVFGSNLNVAGSYVFGASDSNLYGRNKANNTTAISALQEVIFQGSQSVDWQNPITAKIDEKRVKVMYDKTKTLRPQTSAGLYHRCKYWHPVNSNITYDDDESGGNMGTTGFAANEPPNFNVYIMDIFQPSATSTALWQNQATVYWHER